MTAAQAHEVSYFFSISNEFQSALRAQDAVTAELALSEMMGLWLHSDNLRVRERCYQVLAQNGWTDEMTRACA
jgi:predicted AAA+ superfamily ATPase